MQLGRRGRLRFSNMVSMWPRLRLRWRSCLPIAVRILVALGFLESAVVRKSPFLGYSHDAILHEKHSGFSFLILKGIALKG